MKRVRLRRTPTVIFVEDKSFDRATSVLSLINQLSLKRGESEELDPSELDSDSTAQSDEAEVLPKTENSQV